MSNDRTKLVLGTMTFGPQVDEEGSRAMVCRFLDEGHRELDTAYAYNDGDAERMLGAILADIPQERFTLATKVSPRISGKLDGDAVRAQFRESLARLNRNALDILYFHFPDPVTPIARALEAAAEFHARGCFRELGLSNFPAHMVVDVWHLCRRQGWPQPTVYQGMYNALTRNVEMELFPVLRELDMRFYAYNPLAGGLLSGRYANYREEPSSGRFALRSNYRARYWKPSYFAAVRRLSDVCRQADMELSQAALRWLANHSELDASCGDGILIGASKMSHIEQNMTVAQEGPLPDDIVSAFREAWEETASDSPEYFRFIPAQPLPR